MKLKSDPRHQRRIRLMQKLFSWDFNPKQKDQEILKVITHLKSIDRKIVKAAPEWPLKQINNIDLAILRLSLYELLLNKLSPPKVVADEAVELAKEYPYLIITHTKMNARYLNQC